MRRVDRQRTERRRRVVTTIGLSFAVGALVDAGLTWRLPQVHVLPADRPADVQPMEAQPAEPPKAGDEAAVGTAGIISDRAAVAVLRARDLTLPVEGVGRSDLRDSFFDARDGRQHEALDIMAPRHTPVRAVDDGAIAKLLFSQGGGGITIYQFDSSKTFTYYYAHLDRYAEGLQEGQQVRRGEPIGYVGSTGNASATAPHLHFAIFRLPPDQRWWKGEPINPYAVFR